VATIVVVGRSTKEIPWTFFGLLVVFSIPFWVIGAVSGEFLPKSLPLDLPVSALMAFEVRLSCFCQAALPVFSRLDVRAGQVVAAEPLSPMPGAEDIPLDAWPTVPDVFDIIESASHQSDYTEIGAQYDPTLGYPNRLELRCKADVLDCGATYELRNVTPLAGAYADARHRFLVLDLTRDELPPADLLLCRDCLVHLSYPDSRRALANVVRSGIPYLLATTFPAAAVNEDIVTGDWRMINLEAAPFCFPPPLQVLNEGCTEAGGLFADKSLGLWRGEVLARLPWLTG
jgi:hypothetical protein